VSGELAGDGDRDDRASLAAPFERLPAGVEAAGALIGTGADGGRLAFSALLERHARMERTSLMPGCFDQQPAGVGVPGPSR
jgi:hypothetical protein